MNIHCVKDCKYIPQCRLSKEDTQRCKAGETPTTDPLIFGRTWQQIQRLQEGDSGGKK